MPNLVIDYAKALESQLDMDALLDDLHASALSTGLFQLAAIKVYARSFEHGRAAGAKAAFLHLCIHMFEGRSAEQKSMLSDALLATLDKVCPAGIAVAVEICDIDKASYRKRAV